MHGVTEKTDQPATIAVSEQPHSCRPTRIRSWLVPSSIVPCPLAVKGSEIAIASQCSCQQHAYCSLICAIFSTHGTRPGGRKAHPICGSNHTRGDRGGIYSRPLEKELTGTAGRKSPKLGVCEPLPTTCRKPLSRARGDDDGGFRALVLVWLGPIPAPAIL